MQAETAIMPVQPLEQANYDYAGQHRAAEAETTGMSWRARLGHIAGRAALALGLAAGGVAAVESAAPQAAHAEYSKTIGSCRGAFWGLKQEVCVVGIMGEKNPWLGKEWVRNVEVSTPDSGNGFLEVWGDGFYKSVGNGDEWSWNIDKWVDTGTNICGASTDSAGSREIACFRINAG